MRARRVAALYDIHGNLPALEAVLADVGALDPDVVVVGGDVAWGPMPLEVLDRLRALTIPVRWVMGNADREIVEAFDDPRSVTAGPVGEVTAFCAGRMSRQHRDLQASFEPAVVLEIEGLGSVLFCHGSPRSDTEKITRITPAERLAPMLEGVPVDVVVCGHTHQQFDRAIAGKRVVNAGSIGSPYEGVAAAYWLVLGPHIDMRRSDYDLAAALAAMRATGHPYVDDFLMESLIEPEDPASVAELFERDATGAT
jgi:putative phosphoesterase